MEIIEQASEIHAEAEDGNLDKVKSIVDKDPSSLHAKDKDGCTPLHLAAQEDQYEVVEFLLSCGADPQAKDNDGETPLQLARRCQSKRAFAVLDSVQIGGSVDRVCPDSVVTVRNEGFINTLRIVGGIMIVLGVVFMIYLIVRSSQEGMFSKAELEARELFIAVGVGFYHFVIGVLCIGMAQALAEASWAKGASSAQFFHEATLPRCDKTYPTDLQCKSKAIKFRCENCGTEVVSYYLKVGELYQCRKCGTRTEIPSDAVETERGKLP